MAYSGQERIAYEHGKEDGIFGRGYDNPYDIGIEPRSYRAYDEGYAEGSVSTTPPRGPAGPQGDPGNQGSQGVPGIPGVNGSDGRSIYQGSGAPVDCVNVPASSNINGVTTLGRATWIRCSNCSALTFASNRPRAAAMSAALRSLGNRTSMGQRHHTPRGAERRL